MSYTISLDVTGESLDEMMAAIETTLEYQLAPLTEEGSLDERIDAEGGEVILGVTGDRADLTAMLTRADADSDEGDLGLGLDDETMDLAAVALPL